MTKRNWWWGPALAVMIAAFPAKSAIAQISTNTAIVAWATGSGLRFLGTDNVVREFAFTAQKDSSGDTTGNAQLVNMATGAIVGIKINCLSVAGNVATMSGSIVVLNAQTDETDVWFRVADNGEGSSAPPDQITAVETFVPPGPSCSEDQGLKLRNIDAGNIQVFP